MRPSIKKQQIVERLMPLSNNEHLKEVKISPEDAKRDIDVILWSMKLCSLRRYFRQRFWEAETQAAEFAERIEPFPRLETVAEHSWHVADTVLILGGHFPWLNIDHCVKLAILHDKMEILIGDKDPVGRNGTGSKTHAFNISMRDKKDSFERMAIKKYLSKLRPSVQRAQSAALHEILEGKSYEARFVKAVDKVQALAYVVLKKKGIMPDRHLIFTLRYSSKVLEHCPELVAHYSELRSRLLIQVARRRNTTIENIELVAQEPQLSFDF